MANIGYFFINNAKAVQLDFDSKRNIFIIPRGTYIPDWYSSCKEPDFRTDVVKNKRDGAKRLLSDVELNASRPSSVATFLNGSNMSATNLYEVDLDSLRILRCLSNPKTSLIARRKNENFERNFHYLDKSMIQYPYSMEYAEVEPEDVNNDSISVLSSLHSLGVDTTFYINEGSSKTRYMVKDLLTGVSFNVALDVMVIGYTEDGKQTLSLKIKGSETVVITTSIGYLDVSVYNKE